MHEDIGDPQGVRGEPGDPPSAQTLAIDIHELVLANLAAPMLDVAPGSGDCRISQQAFEMGWDQCGAVSA